MQPFRHRVSIRLSAWPDFWAKSFDLEDADILVRALDPDPSILRMSEAVGGT